MTDGTMRTHYARPTRIATIAAVKDVEITSRGGEWSDWVDLHVVRLDETSVTAVQFKAESDWPDGQEAHYTMGAWQILCVREGETDDALASGHDYLRGTPHTIVHTALLEGRAGDRIKLQARYNAKRKCTMRFAAADIDASIMVGGWVDG